MEEKFKQIFIDNEPTTYYISNLGRCINVKTNKFLKPHKLVRKHKILEPIDPDNCYYDYALFFNKRYYYKTIHRLVAEYFIDIPEKYISNGLTINDLEVDHIDNIKYHNYEDNLQWLTPRENYLKMIKSGAFRVPSGAKHGSCKLTHEQLDLVGELLQENKLTQDKISEITGVPYNTILEIRAKRRFKYLSDKFDFENYDKIRKIYDHDCIMNIIKDISNSDLSLSKISKKYNVSKSLVKDIYHRRVHSDLSKNYDFSKRINR